jgi:hypothetical protein
MSCKRIYAHEDDVTACARARGPAGKRGKVSRGHLAPVGNRRGEERALFTTSVESGAASLYCSASICYH